MAGKLAAKLVGPANTRVGALETLLARVNALTGFVPTYRQVATRCFRANNYFTATTKAIRGVSFHYNRSGQTLSTLRLVYQSIAKTTSSSNVAGTGLEVALSAKTIMWGVEYPVGSGSFTQILWNRGATSAAVPLGGTQVSDDTHLIVPIPDGAMFALRPLITSVNGNIGYTHNVAFGVAANTLLMPNEGVETSTTTLTDTTMGGAMTLGNIGLITPNAIIGLGTKGAVLIAGDSIALGLADNVQHATYPSVTGDPGLIAPSIGATNPYINLGVPSQRGYVWLDNNVADLDLLQWCQSSISNFGVNDYDRVARTLPEVLAMLAGVSSVLGSSARGAKPVYQTTITPVQGGTHEAVRIAANDQIRANALGFTGYFEAADAVETARNSSVFKNGYSTDFTHLLPQGRAGVKAQNIFTSVYA